MTNLTNYLTKRNAINHGTALISVCFQCNAMAADAAITPSGSVFKMLMGLAVVLAVMALITWLLKRMMPGTGSQHSVARVVGGVSVGSRERVVVVEVGNRWLVVGVAPGHVTSIADLEIGDTQFASTLSSGTSAVSSNIPGYAQPIVNSFAGWLKQSTAKFNSKKTDS